MMAEPSVKVERESEDVSAVKEEVQCSKREYPASEVKRESPVESKTESGDGPVVKEEILQSPAKKQKLEEPVNNGGVDKDSDTANGEQALTAEEKGVANLEDSIVSQIEYYFGNANLPKDKFLQEQIKLEDGWIPIEVMLRFKRLAQLSKNPSTVVKALRNSSLLMEVNEDGSKIRRSPSKPLPVMNEEWMKALNDRSVYCKGFPVNVDTVSPYLDFFKPYGPIESVKLRRYRDKATKQSIFKGSVDVIFETKELADKFLALESVKFEEKELLRMTQAAHAEQKKKELEEKWGRKVKKDPKESKEQEGKKDFAKGCILKIPDIKDEELTREDIKSTLVELGADVAFIQFNKGETEALVRLNSSEEGAATQFLAKLGEQPKVKLGEAEHEVTVLGGDEEEKFLEQTRQNMLRFSKGHKNRRGNHQKFRGFRGQKRGRSPAKDGPSNKKVAVS